MVSKQLKKAGAHRAAKLRADSCNLLVTSQEGRSHTSGPNPVPESFQSVSSPGLRSDEK